MSQINEEEESCVSRLEIMSPNRAQMVVEGLYRDVERRITASPPGLCPVDLSLAFLHLCHAQTCGKCVPCRVGLHQLKHMITNVLNGDADYEILDLIEETALSIMQTADCAIGSEAAKMVWRMVHTLNSFLVCASTPLDASMTITAESAAISVR